MRKTTLERLRFLKTTRQNLRNRRRRTYGQEVAMASRKQNGSRTSRTRSASSRCLGRRSIIIYGALWPGRQDGRVTQSTSGRPGRVYGYHNRSPESTIMPNMAFVCGVVDGVSAVYQPHDQQLQ